MFPGDRDNVYVPTNEDINVIRNAVELVRRVIRENNGDKDAARAELSRIHQEEMAQFVNSKSNKGMYQPVSSELELPIFERGYRLSGLSIRMDC